MAEEELGEEELGDELEEMLTDLGIEGHEAEEVGRKMRKRWKKIGRRKIRGVGGDLSRQLPFLMSRSVALADGSAVNLTGNCDRRSSLSAMYVEANNAAGVRVFGIHVTGTQINGRNAVVGAGSIPAGLAFGDFAQAADGDDQWSLGICDQGGAAVVNVSNDSGAAADIYAGFRALTTD